MMLRCDWPGGEDPVYQEYHDREWGVPVHDDARMFEFLILEGAQAGLSWLTILKRREHYRAAYANFNPELMARWTDADMALLMEDRRIIRNRLKIASARNNARAYLEWAERHSSFSDFLWSFVDGRPQVNAWPSWREVPATTPTSDRLAKTLKKLGFNFVGSTICYAHMQAVGMVNDHIVECFRYPELGGQHSGHD